MERAQPPNLQNKREEEVRSVEQRSPQRARLKKNLKKNGCRPSSQFSLSRSNTPWDFLPNSSTKSENPVETWGTFCTPNNSAGGAPTLPIALIVNKLPNHGLFIQVLYQPVDLGVLHASPNTLKAQ